MSQIPIPVLYPEFEHLDLRWFKKWRHYGVNIFQGEFCVSDKNIVMSAVLGSCISACVYDCKHGVGGMNHFMLPSTENNRDNALCLRFGLFAMEQLINALLKRGSVKEDLRFKVVGGGSMIKGLFHIGQLNIDFIESYLHKESFYIESCDLGGEQARKVAFFPATGRLMVNHIPRMYSGTLIAKENIEANTGLIQTEENEVEMF